MPDIKATAGTIFAWALENGLYVSPTGSRVATGLSGGANPELPAMEEGSEALRKRGISMLSINEENNQIIIHTSGKLSKKERNQLPTAIEGIKISYMQSKALSVGQPTGVAQRGASPYWQHRGYYTCGSSISIGNLRDAGTMGCLVRKDGQIYGLTNNHVTGGCNNTKIGTPVVAPGITDVCFQSIDPFTIGRHYEVLPMQQGDPAVVNPSNNQDAAIFHISSPNLVSSMQGTYFDTPSLLGSPSDNLEVEKVGRTTDRTVGKVISKVFLPVGVLCGARSYPSANDEEAVNFRGTVYYSDVYAVVGNSGPFSLSGDSGSLVVTADSTGGRKAVGIVFAGDGQITYILPIKPILEGLGAAIVHGHNL